MKLVSASTQLKDDCFVLELNEPCKCRIGLVEFNLPNINQQACDGNAIEISCDQLDSTFHNPLRILKTICYNRVRGDAYYNNWAAKNIQFHDVDSSDKFLKFRIKRAVGGKNIRFHKSVNETNPTIFFTIAMEPITSENMCWTNI